jgi:hypothetical protein
MTKEESVKSIILNGALGEDPTLDRVQQVLTRELTGMDWEVTDLILRQVEIATCVGCFGCWIRTPGLCIIDDAARDVARAMAQSNLVVYLSPVTFGGYSSELKKVLDRNICHILPFFTRIDGEVHHKPRYTHYPRLLGVGTLDRADAECERIFTTLVERNAINMHAPAHAAAVVYEDQSDEAIAQRLCRLFDAVEVSA